MQPSIIFTTSVFYTMLANLDSNISLSNSDTFQSKQVQTFSILTLSKLISLWHFPILTISDSDTSYSDSFQLWHFLILALKMDSATFFLILSRFSHRLEWKIPWLTETLSFSSVQFDRQTYPISISFFWNHLVCPQFREFFFWHTAGWKNSAEYIF